MASTYIYRDYNSAPTNGNKATFSMWVKRGAISSGSRQKIIGAYDGGSAGQYLEFNTDDTIRYHSGSGGAISSTNAKFRDGFGWYHIVVQHDTTGSGTSDQVKIYVNGELQSMANNYGASVASQFGKNSVKAVLGAEESGYSSQYYDGLISHFHFIDGTIYAPTVFGSTDSTTGEWKINTSPSVTYGTNGCFLFKDDNSLNDDSTNSNNFTLGNGTLTKTEDCPSNVFATWNKLDWGTTYFTLTNGSTTAQSNASVFTYGVSTLGVNSGKFYWEVEYDAKNGGNRFPQIGITSTQTTNTQYELGHYANDWCYYTNDTTGKLRNNNADNNWGTYYQEGDIIGVALDLDNNKLYFSKNGTWQESGDPSAGNNGISITAPSSTPLGFYFPAICYYDSTYRGTFKANFGNGYFGTTAVSSAGTNASGNGIFEYDVPTGYTALSTKGLNE